MFPTASIVDSLVNVCTDVIGATGYAGIYVLTLLGSACIPVPSEATMMFAGFKVSDGDLAFVGVILAGVLGELTGACIAYAAGYYGRIELLERHHVFHIDRKRLDAADAWFKRHGDATVFFGRLLPVVRAFIALPAGVSRVPLRHFIPLTIAASTIWLTMLAAIGVKVGDNWEDWRDRLGYLDYVVVAAVVGLIIYAVMRRRRGSPGRGAGPDPAEQRPEVEPAAEA
jgi:membrane protein DedA with SNARE-associated domain